MGRIIPLLLVEFFQILKLWSSNSTRIPCIVSYRKSKLNIAQITCLWPSFAPYLRALRPLHLLCFLKGRKLAGLPYQTYYASFVVNSGTPSSAYCSEGATSKELRMSQAQGCWGVGSRLR